MSRSSQVVFSFQMFVSRKPYVPHVPSFLSSFELQFCQCLVLHKMWTEITREDRKSVATKFNNAVLCAFHVPFFVIWVILVSSDSILIVSDQEQKDIKERQ